MKRDKVWLWLAYLLPKTLVMWASVRMISNATTGQYSKQIVPDLSAMEALRRW